MWTARDGAQTESTLYVMVGPPATEKAKAARSMAQQRGALLLLADDWTIPLLGTGQPAKRDVVEGRLVWLALNALRCGTDVVLDLGGQSRHERSALRYLAASSGAECQLVYVPPDDGKQLGSGDVRGSTGTKRSDHPGDHDSTALREVFDVHDAEALDGAISPPPVGYGSWAEWAARRWPTSLG